MNNVFFEFLETYWEDIAEFLRSFVEFIQALIGKVSGGEAEEA